MQHLAAYEPGQLVAQLETLPQAGAWWVGFSGGADSTALLITLTELQNHFPVTVRAIHFNHQLHQDARKWEDHCRQVCRRLGIELAVETLHLPADQQRSPEAVARQHRYAHMERRLGDDDVYLTAHHADDNAETLFLNLMRGSGIDGLAAIPPLRKCGRGWVARPMIELRREQLRQFLRHRAIHWLEDPSNDDQRLDRNFLRHRVFPVIEERWPGMVPRLDRSARYAREASEMLTGLVGRHAEAGDLDAVCLPVPSLVSLPLAEQAVLIRHWIRAKEALPPPHARLYELLRQLNTDRATPAACELQWAGNIIKQHNDLLWFLQQPWPRRCPARSWAEAGQLGLGEEFGTVDLAGAAPPAPDSSWSIGPVQPGGRMALHRDGPRRKVHELLRESGIPGWLREAVPVLYSGGEVLAVGDWQLSPELRDWLERSRSDYHWTPAHPMLEQIRQLGHSAAGP